jgi:serine/threonine protein kinase
MPADRFVPDAETLRRFRLGRLDAAQAARVQRYLETHPDAADSPDTSLSGVVPFSKTDRGDDDDEAEDNLQFLSAAQATGELGRLGGYRVLRILGRGGMGLVLEAVDLQLGRHVAIKVMRPKFASVSKARERFIREAQAAARVEHDHIIPIYFIGEHNGVPYIVMPFLKGESLDERLKREGQLSVADILRIGRQTADGLAAAHEHGLVHRDIKPANLWLEAPKARVKILDFGLARLSSDAGQLTQTGAILGTPAYMAPEQARSKSIDGRTDLFSLGAVLYRLATGRTPFGGADTMSILMALATETPSHPLFINPDLPPHLADLIMRLLQKDPRHRPQSAREVAEQLVPAPVVEAFAAPAPGTLNEFDFGRDDSMNSDVPMASPVATVLPRQPEIPRMLARERSDKKPVRAGTRRGLLIAAALLLAFIAIALGAYKLVFASR